MQASTRRFMVQQIGDEFEGVDLGDARRDTRAVAVAMALAAKPHASLPRALRTESELQAGYRLLGNRRVDWRDLLEPHVECTVERARALGVVLAVHDTSTMKFKGEAREDELGIVENDGSGFFLHASLAVSAEDQRRPLGVLRLHALLREEQPKLSKSKQVMRSKKKDQKDKESDRWRAGALEVQERFSSETKVIHVMDRESDSFPLMAALQEGGCSFVIRAKYDRVLGDGLKLRETVEAIEGEALRDVPLSKRKSINKRYAHPERNARMASLHFRAHRVVLPKPDEARAAVRSLEVNVVHVYEPNPPAGEPAVDWLLLTTEPVQTLAQALQVVDWYRARWVIEEYFKALKTGCAYEKRQLETLSGLLNALALLAPIAWALLHLRSTARESPGAPASDFFSSEELRLLRGLSVRVKLAAKPTLHDAMLAIAGLGGHLKRNGDPGWQTLGEGFLELLAAQRVLAAVRREKL